MSKQNATTYKEVKKHISGDNNLYIDVLCEKVVLKTICVNKRQRLVTLANLESRNNKFKSLSNFLDGFPAVSPASIQPLASVLRKSLHSSIR